MQLILVTLRYINGIAIHSIASTETDLKDQLKYSTIAIACGSLLLLVTKPGRMEKIIHCQL